MHAGVMERLLQLGAGGLPGMGQVCGHLSCSELAVTSLSLSLSPGLPELIPPSLSLSLPLPLTLPRPLSSSPSFTTSLSLSLSLPLSLIPHSLSLSPSLPPLSPSLPLSSSSLLSLSLSHWLQPQPGVDAPMMDTAEMVYISSLALLKVQHNPIHQCTLHARVLTV